MSGLLLTKQVNLNDVAIPSDGDVVAFVDADGRLKTRLPNGSVLEPLSGDVGALAINVGRAGVVAGLDVFNAIKSVALNGRIVRVKGSVKVVSTAVGTVAMGANVGGFVFTFPTLPTAIANQFYDFELNIHIKTDLSIAFATIKQSIAAAGVNAAPSQASHATVAGAFSGALVQAQIKTPVTATITTQFVSCELL